MQFLERISCNPDVMMGKPVIKGTRITIEVILKKLSEGVSIQDILSAYPHLERDDVLAAISYSAEVISREEMIVS